jgi:hypothetical protein
LATAADGIHWDTPNQEFDIQINSRDPYKEKWVIGQKVTDETMRVGEDMKSVGDFGTSDRRNPNSAPAATKCYNYLMVAYRSPELGPFIVRMQKTSERVGKRLNQAIRSTDVDAFGQRYILGAEFVDDGPENKYFRFKYTPDGLLGEGDLELYQALERQFEHFSKIEAWSIRESDQDVDVVAPINVGTAEVSDEM